MAERFVLPPRALTPLDAANRVFGDAYRSTREHARQNVPIMVLLPGEVVLRCGEQRRAFPLFLRIILRPPRVLLTSWSRCSP